MTVTDGQTFILKETIAQTVAHGVNNAMVIVWFPWNAWAEILYTVYFECKSLCLLNAYM